MMHTGNTSGDSSSPDTSTPAPDSRYLQDLLNRVDSATAPPPSVAAPSALSRAVDRASSFFSSARSQRHTRLSDADEGEGVVPRDFGDYDDGGSSQSSATSDLGSFVQALMSCDLEASLGPDSWVHCLLWLRSGVGRLYFLSAVCGMLVGLVAGNNNFTNHAISTHFDTGSTHFHQLLAMMSIGGAVGGALLGGLIADRFGRRLLLSVQAIVMVPATIAATFAASFELVAAARFFTSMLAASCWVAGMALVTESAPATERGMAGAGFQLAMVIGWMTCKVAATWTSDETMALSGWRLLTGTQIALACLELAALCRVPESAKYLADMGRFDDAHTSVRRLYGIEAGPFETHETVTHELNTLPTRSAAEREGTGFAGCFTTATRWRPSFMLLYALVTSAHSGGGLQTLYRIHPILEKLALSSEDHDVDYIITISMSLAALLAVVLIEPLGRRGLIHLGATMLVGGTVLLGLLLILFYLQGPPGASFLMAGLAIVGSTAAIGGWQLVIGSVLPVMVCESVPAFARGRCLGSLFAASALYAPSTLAIFDSAVRRNGEGIALLYHASIGGTMFLTFCFFFSVETRLKSPEQILADIRMAGKRAYWSCWQCSQGTWCEDGCKHMAYSQLSAKPLGGMDGMAEDGAVGHMDDADDDEHDAYDMEDDDLELGPLEEMRARRKERERAKLAPPSAARMHRGRGKKGGFVGRAGHKKSSGGYEMDGDGGFDESSSDEEYQEEIEFHQPPRDRGAPAAARYEYDGSGAGGAGRGGEGAGGSGIGGGNRFDNRQEQQRQVPPPPPPAESTMTAADRLRARWGIGAKEREHEEENELVERDGQGEADAEAGGGGGGAGRVGGGEGGGLVGSAAESEGESGDELKPAQRRRQRKAAAKMFDDMLDM